MGIRSGEIKVDLWIGSFNPAADGQLKFPLKRWKRRPGLTTASSLATFDDDNIVPFADIVRSRGSGWREAALNPEGGPYLLDDGWCDLLDECRVRSERRLTARPGRLRGR